MFCKEEREEAGTSVDKVLIYEVVCIGNAGYRNHDTRGGPKRAVQYRLRIRIQGWN